MATAADLGKRLQLHIHKSIRERRQYAVMGRLQANGRLTLRTQADGTNLPRNKIYVRLNGDSAQTREVWNIRTGSKAGLPCWVELNNRKELEVTELDSKTGTDFLGEYLPSFATPPTDTETNGNIKIAGASLNMGRVLPTSTSNLVFQVLPFWYKYFDSVKYWPGTATIDLSSYLPVTSGFWHWAWIAVDPKDNTLTVKTSEEVSLKQLLTTTSLMATDMSGFVPCDAVTVQEAATAFNTTDNDIQFGRALNDQYTPVTPTTLGTGLIGHDRVLKLYDEIIFSGLMTIKGQVYFG